MEQSPTALPQSGYGALYEDYMNRYPGTAEPRQSLGEFTDEFDWHEEVLITAGGTQEPIDDVRYVGNFSGGRFGHALAQEYASHGHDVTLFAPSSVIERFGAIDGVRHKPFTSSQDLMNLMLNDVDAVDLVLHAAAVADYRPRKVDGKISSDQEQMTIEMERTPKILSHLRERYGSHTTIVGFKLLSGVTVENLTDVAKAQIEKNKTDYSVANLLDDINGARGERSVHLVDGTGAVVELTGKTAMVASGLYRAIKWSSRGKVRHG